MLKHILVLVIILVGNLSFSQTTENQNGKAEGTNLEEYNYLTKEYKGQVSFGNDLKEGYSLERMSVRKRGRYSFIFTALIRTEEKELAGFSLIVKSWDTETNYFLGLPINNPELQLRFEEEVSKLDENTTTALAQHLGQLYSEVLISFFTREHKKQAE